MIAERINGKYWMYMSHRGWLASSEDLIHWDLETDEFGNVKCLFPEFPQQSYCRYSCEAGAAAIITQHGIVYFFNAYGEIHKPELGHCWSLGQALVSIEDMVTVKDILKSPFLIPEYEWETSGGHTKDPCIVCNTMIKWKGKWTLYYGARDHYIGCAVEDVIV